MMRAGLGVIYAELEVIYAPTYRVDRRTLENPRTPANLVESHPFRLHANFRPPQMMEITFVMLYGGSEEFIIRARTREAIDECIEQNGWRDHPRLRRLMLTKPDGSEELLAGRKL